MELTKTEFEVCAYTASGYEAKETASKLFRSVLTIRTHIQKVRIKNKLKNVAEITRDFVLEYGDPRQYIATVLLVVQLGIIYTDCSDDLRRTRRTKVSKKMKKAKSKTGRKTKELYG